MPKQTATADVLVFETALGWMAARCAGHTLVGLSFGHSTAESAARASGLGSSSPARPDAWGGQLIALLQAYAAGEPVDFSGIPADPGVATAFQRRVYAQCRRIPYGQTRTYAQLASQAGSPGAARAVGNCMARNPIPLVIPCHRVVGSGGGLGGFSAPGGTRTKRTLLALEGFAAGKLA